LPSLVHVDRVKKCWADPETILAPQPARLNTLQPLAVVEQKGARYRVQFVDIEGSMESSTRWLRESEVPSSLLSAWRVGHRKDGGARVRRPVQQGSITTVSNRQQKVRASIPDTESATSSEEESDGPAFSRKRVTPPSDSSPVPLRRSSRNVSRINYRDFDDHGFD
jgi:hypothetical protein